MRSFWSQASSPEHRQTSRGSFSILFSHRSFQKPAISPAFLVWFSRKKDRWKECGSYPWKTTSLLRWVSPGAEAWSSALRRCRRTSISAAPCVPEGQPPAEECTRISCGWLSLKKEETRSLARLNFRKGLNRFNYRSGHCSADCQWSTGQSEQ